ncbi:hypothetical protein ACK2J6_001233 [Vibrio fluvialis]
MNSLKCKPHVARIFAPNVALPEQEERGAWVWAVWASKAERDGGYEPVNWSLHCAFIRVTVRDLIAKSKGL